MIKLFVGAPGCGKSTLTCYYTMKYRKDALKKAQKGQKGEYDYIYSNSDIFGANIFERNDLGKNVFPPRSLVLVDEAGVDFNSRKTLKMSDDCNKYLKKHRHYDNDLFFFSQSMDIDIVIQRLATEVWHCKKLGCFTLCRRIIKDLDINENTKQLEDCYKKVPLYKRFLPPPFGDFSFFLVYRPKYYRYFDSWEKENKPFFKGMPIVGK